MYLPTGESRHIKETLLTASDRELLRTIEPIVEGVAKLFRHCEVALYSLDDLRHALIKVENGRVINRNADTDEAQSGISVFAESISSSSGEIGSDFIKTDDARTQKSSTTMIRNARGEPIGIFCLNIDLSMPLLDFIESMSPTNSGSISKTEAPFPDNIEELVEKTYRHNRQVVESMTDVPLSERSKLIVTRMSETGIFLVKGAVDYVANEIGVSKYTVYNYLKEVKEDKGSTRSE